MSVLEFGLKSFFRPRIYEITRDDAPAGTIECSWMWERAIITIDGTSHVAAREGKMSGAFYLETNGNRVAIAEKPSTRGRLFTVQVGDRTLTLKAASTFGSSFILTEHDVQIGVIARLGWLTQKWRAALPADLALEVQAFLIWLVIILLRRTQGVILATSSINTTPGRS
jgi:hypothetical protein